MNYKDNSIQYILCFVYIVVAITSVESRFSYTGYALAQLEVYAGGTNAQLEVYAGGTNAQLEVYTILAGGNLLLRREGKTPYAGAFILGFATPIRREKGLFTPDISAEIPLDSRVELLYRQSWYGSILQMHYKRAAKYVLNDFTKRLK